MRTILLYFKKKNTNTKKYKGTIQTLKVKYIKQRVRRKSICWLFGKIVFQRHIVDKHTYTYEYIDVQTSYNYRPYTTTQIQLHFPILATVHISCICSCSWYFVFTFEFILQWKSFNRNIIKNQINKLTVTVRLNSKHYTI